MASDVAKEKFRDSLAAGIDKYVKMPGRNTISQNCERDSGCAGYARIPGPDACDFCVTMGAASDFYHTEKTAGGGISHGTADDAYHPYCNCQIAMIFKKSGRYVAKDPETGERMPYDGKELVKRYKEAGSPRFNSKQAGSAKRKAKGGGGNKPPVPPSKKTGGGSDDWRKKRDEALKREKPIDKRLNEEWAAYQANKTEAVYDATVRKAILEHFVGFESLVEVETGAQVIAKEISTAKKLVQRGHHVKFRSPIYGYKKKNPDFFLDRVYIADFKRIESENPNKVFNHIKHAVVDQKAECVVVDLSFESISVEDAVMMAQRTISNPAIDVKQVIILYGEKMEIILP